MTDKVEKVSQWGKCGIMISTLALIILVGVLYVGVYALIEQNKMLAHAVSGLQTQVSHQPDLQKTMSDLQTAAETNQSQLATLQTALTDLRNTNQDNKVVWQIGEARYLTRLAQDNLLLEDNVSLVITLLQSADQTLSQLTDPNITEVRKALASDITALQAVPVVDVSGIYLKLAALNDQVEQLSLPMTPSTEKVKLAEAANDLPWWQRGLHQSWQTLKQLVVVRYHNATERPFLSPEQQAYLQQNLHAELEQAMTALLQKNAVVYKSSLTQASAWVKTYFVQDAPGTVAMLKSLDELQTTVIRPELPNLKASLAAFDQVKEG